MNPDVLVVPALRLRPEHLERWRFLQESNPDLANPCFSPEFVLSVATVRDDVEVAILQSNGGVVGFFPFQRKGRSRAIPAGGIVSDYQGLVCGPGFQCDPRQLLKACGLVAWDFDRLIATQSSFKSFHRLCEPSAQIDLSQGYQAYAAERSAAGTRQLRDCEYRMRRLEREVGPLRFVAHSNDTGALERVVAWKSQQYRRSGWPDLFASDWGCGLVRQIHAVQTPSFAGMLSLLYAGSFLIAGHLGMRSQTVWHYWFPAYDRRFAKYSPGLILLLKMAQVAEELGLRSIDVGTGISLYKKRLMNASIDVAEGSVERPSLLHAVRSARRSLSALLKRSRASKQSY
ncbi:MAG TPA: GNAT family N-acetyltransferase [Verrucomicrobiae bacterium]|nr:GNAT family N-acetyltransferase [Verrucomicrobiae bacterium]